MTNNVVYIASDHRGFPLKTKLVSWLRERGYEPCDLGPQNEDRCNAFLYARKVAEAMRKDPTARGVLICGTGQAMAMTANRHQHLRAALCTNSTMAKMAREHNDANVLVMGANIIDAATMLECLNVFLNTEFLGGVYADRRDELTALGGV